MPSKKNDAGGAPERLLVCCLCAAWCGTCRDYRATFDAVAASFPDHAYAWIDIENESALFDDLALDLDIETFPTIAVVRGESLRFFGPLLPQPSALSRIVQASGEAVQTVGIDAEEGAALARRLAARGPD